MKLHTEMVRYGEGGRATGYLAVPEAGAGSKPALIVIQEIWGVNSHIQDLTERFAQAGYAALAPDLFAENGVRLGALDNARIERARAFLHSLDPSAWSDPSKREEGLSQLPAEEAESIGATLEALLGDPEKRAARMASYMEKLRDAVSYLANEHPVSKGRGVGVIGFCLGGALAGRLSAHPDIRASVMFYGAPLNDEEAAKAECPILGIFAEQDPNITGRVPEMAEAMERLGKPFEYIVYPGTKHAFFNDTNRTYDADAARDAFARVIAFMNERLRS